MAGTLYTYPENFRAQKILIAAEYSGNKVRVVSEPPEFVLGETNKSKQFLSKFPLGKVPAFETSTGETIFESNAIAYYVATPALRGATDLDAAVVLQYVNFADNEILPPASTWVFPTLGLMQYNKEGTRNAQERIRQLLSYLNDTLSTRTFLVGERITLADITLVCNLLMLYKHVLEPGFRAPYANVNRWFNTCINQPQFKSVLGDVKLCEKMAQFDSKKYNELFGKEKKDGKKKEEKKKEDKKQAPKKEAPAKEQPENDLEDDDTPKPSKFVDPYADLPKSSFILDEFKRYYFNEDTVTKTIPFLWEKFDKEGWSIWKAEYSYPEDLRMIFMSSNLVSGMMQRLDKLNKYAFASVCIMGVNNNNTISGIWIMRGQELAFNLRDDWNIDAPSYKFTKLDSTNEEHRRMVNAYLVQEEIDGREVVDAKTFK